MAKALKDIKDIASIFPTAEAIPEQFRQAPLEQREYLCNGELRHWAGDMVEVKGAVWTKQADGSLKQEIIGHYPLMDTKTALEALDAAEKAFNNGNGVWPKMTVTDRIGCMQRFVVRMKRVRDQVSKLLMWEIGKNLKTAQGEFDRTVDYIVDTIDNYKELDREASKFTVTGGVVAQVRRVPLGVVLCMGPYNYPLNETCTTLIPALIMGNTIVLKPARMGVLLWQPMLEALKDCFPAGVINTIYGKGHTIMPPIMQSGKLASLAFIGTSKAADALKKQHPMPHRLKAALGLEAKNCAIILPDADIDLTVNEVATGALSFNGQRCTALKIICVHQSIADKFTAAFVAKIESLKGGMPWEGADITPLPDMESTERMAAILKDALDKGAKLVNAGGEHAGTFFHPAVITNVTSEMRAFQEEQFGPIVPIMTFFDVAEPIKVIETSQYGQQCAIFGRDPSSIASLVDRLTFQVCRVNINSQCQRGPDVLPFSGRKDSAEGTLSVSDALRVFSIRTLVAAKNTEANNDLITTIVQQRKSRFLSTDFIL